MFCVVSKGIYQYLLSQIRNADKITFLVQKLKKTMVSKVRESSVLVILKQAWKNEF